jgi:hypothetical protein
MQPTYYNGRMWLTFYPRSHKAIYVYSWQDMSDASRFKAFAYWRR